MQTKVCTVCGVDKTLDQYRKYSGRGVMGLRPLCKICQRAYEKTWRSNSKENRKIARAKRKDKAKIYAQEYRAKNRAAYLIAECRRRCAKRGWDFDLDIYAKQIQSRIDLGICEVSGIPLNLLPTEGRQYNSPSIDRIDPNQRYVYKNIRIVAFAVNAMLGDWGEDKALMILKSWEKRAG